MTTDNTQAELRGQLTELLTSINRYFHTEPDERLVEFITDYTKKQIEAVLDRLKQELPYNDDWKPESDIEVGQIETRESMILAIEAERKRLKESKL